MLFQTDIFFEEMEKLLKDESEYWTYQFFNISIHNSFIKFQKLDRDGKISIKERICQADALVSIFTS